VGCVHEKTSRAGRADAGRCVREKWTGQWFERKEKGGAGWAGFEGEAGFPPMAGCK
jgi:hypothetical protein